MATKPDPVGDLPPAWGDAGVYAASLYPALFPWGDANPLGGLPTPWSGQPRLNATGLTSFASSALEPQQPNDASVFNEWLRRVQVWAPWVADGSSASGEDAHLVETDATGQVNLARGMFGGNLATVPGLRVTPTVGAIGSTISGGSETAIECDNSSADPTLRLNNVGAGLDLELVGESAFNGKANFNGDVALGDGTGSIVDVGGGATDVANLNTNLVGTISTIVQTGLVELLVGAPSPAAGQLAVGVTGSLGFHDGSSGKFVHYSSAGFVYATGDQQAATGLLAAHLVAQTSASATAQGGQVRVIIYGELQVSSLGSTFTLAAQEDQGGFTDIAPNKIVTALVDGSDANDWQPFRHERVFAPLTTATFYRLSATAQGGRTINLREVRLRVVKERY